ncbi:hypothetical protein [Mesorhizobium sp. dw_380]|uniref:hypothetical protein n=1 Tax=Mesorhizobium sp. dw_380 TaxID=2812001 RepID=UPI002032A44F|nr:hypothetical protein [Mesorhizobium sp. dw_380]
MKTPDAPAIPLKPIVEAAKILSKRLTIRIDEATRRKFADTDGTVRRARQIAESNRLI